MKFAKRRNKSRPSRRAVRIVGKPQNLPLQSSDYGYFDLYHWLLIIPWWQFTLILMGSYIGINTIFAIAYMLAGDGIANAEIGSFQDSFFFSVQTMSTVGYGALYPKSLEAQLLVTSEVLLGIFLLAILTGLLFARFSRPTARILFSKVAVICPYNGIPTLMFRAANQRDNRILEAQVKITFLRDEVSQEGHVLRRFYDLKLIRSQSSVFWLSWLVMHPIDEESPLYGENVASLAESDGLVWVTMTGLDETFSQIIHARYSYSMGEVLWNQRFVDIFSETPDGKYLIDYRLFHDVVPI